MARYNDQDRAAALARLDMNGGNVKKTALELGVPRQTLQEWRDGRVPEGVPETRHMKRGAIADRLQEMVETAIEVAVKKLAAGSLHEVNGSIKIGTEMMQLLRGDPTSISETRQQDLSPDERADRIQALLDEGRNRRSLALSDGGPASGDRPPSPVN